MQHATIFPPRFGFSLVELSIVLVILGLLVGGILAGQSLIRASELRSITTENIKYTTAIHAFRDKYFALPGDMANATAFWGAANTAGAGGQCAAPATNAGTGTQTCNGTGDGFISFAGTTADRWERFRVWQHLASAQMIEGVYSGVDGPSGTGSHSVPGTNVPAGKITGTGWSISYNQASAGSATDFVFAPAGNTLQIGGTSVNTVPNIEFLSPQEAWNIDVKTDDGKPGRGKTIVKYWSDCTLAADQSDLDANYKNVKSIPGCILKFAYGF